MLFVFQLVHRAVFSTMVHVISIFHRNKPMTSKVLALQMSLSMKVIEHGSEENQPRHSFILAASRCHLLRARLWDIESINEFDYVLARIYAQTQKFDSPRIAVNFTNGKRRELIDSMRVFPHHGWIVFFLVLHLQRRLGEQQFLSVGNTNDYSLIYKPLPDLPPSNTCLIIDISKAMQRISLEEKFRLERRSNHYICKMSMSHSRNSRSSHAPFSRNQQLLQQYTLWSTRSMSKSHL